MQIPIGISNRHIHLSEEDAKILFGKKHNFKNLKELSQPGQFALKETVSIQTSNGTDNNKINNIRILGPRRTQTQIEIMASDQYILNVQAPTRLSGDLTDTPGIKIIGPEGTLEVQTGLIIAQRHLHASPKQAEELGLEDKQSVSIKTSGGRAITFHNIIVRVKPSYKLDFHIDFDEANAGNIQRGDTGEIIR